MEVLAVTNMYPSTTHPAVGTFIEEQVESLRDVSIKVTVLQFDRIGKGPGVYRQVQKRLLEILRTSTPDLIHIMYGGAMPIS